MRGTSVTRIASGTYRVEQDGRADIVYVAGPEGDRWAFSNGTVFHGAVGGQSHAPIQSAGTSSQSLFAPMPATVVKVLVQPGAAVKKGTVVVLLEAMKMELPVRALADAVVAAIHCREGELVQADALLIEFQ